MNIEARKLTLLQRLLNVREESVLKKIEEALAGEIVAHTTDGNPLTLKDYYKAIQAGEEDVKAGRTYTTEEMVKAIKS